MQEQLKQTLKLISIMHHNVFSNRGLIQRNATCLFQFLLLCYSCPVNQSQKFLIHMPFTADQTQELPCFMCRYFA
jgi:hypothetical protein